MKQYQDLLRKILVEGIEKESGRENMPNTIGISHAVIQMDLQEGFPLLTTKKMYWKGIVHELLWFLRGETNIKYLVDNNVNIWNGDAYHFFKERLWLLPNIDLITQEIFIERVKNGDFEDKFNYKYGDLGAVYGHNWRNYNGKLPYYHFGNKPKIDVSKHKTFGFGDKGIYKGVKKHFLFQTWSNMISRCYNYNDPKFKIYGGKGVYVCDSWLNFDTFVEDASKLENYEQKLKTPSNYQLDKDYLGGKCYSKESCVWMTISKNSKLTIKQFEYTISNGVDCVTFTNIEEAARKIKVDPTNLNRVCNGVRKTVGKWYLTNKKDLFKGEDQLKSIINSLQQTPFSRYHVLDGWNPIQRKLCALAPCHLLYQFICRPLTLSESTIWCDENPTKELPKYYLDLNMYHRSCDTFLGGGFNLASMSLLCHIIAKVSNMEVGVATWIGGDTHIYKEHIPMVEEQLTREPYDLCGLKINKKLNSLDDILSLSIDDFEFTNYISHPAIKAELFTGNKK